MSLINEIQIGLDLATSTTIVAGAVSFLVANARSSAKERIERRQNIRFSHQLEAVNSLHKSLEGLLHFRENVFFKHHINDESNPFDNREAFDSVNKILISLKTFSDGPNKTWGDATSQKIIDDVSREIHSMKVEVFKSENIGERMAIMGEIYEKASNAFLALNNHWFGEHHHPRKS